LLIKRVIRTAWGACRAPGHRADEESYLKAREILHFVPKAIAVPIGHPAPPSASDSGKSYGTQPVSSLRSWLVDPQCREKARPRRPPPREVQTFRGLAFTSSWSAIVHLSELYRGGPSGGDGMSQRRSNRSPTTASRVSCEYYGSTRS
jgi:hypothetical protein